MVVPCGAGIVDQWRTQWSPFSHINNPRPTLVKGWESANQSRISSKSPPERGAISGTASRHRGWPYLPDCNHMWLSSGPCTNEVTTYAEDLSESYNEKDVCSSVAKGDLLIRQFGDLYTSVVNIQECEVRKHKDPLRCAIHLWGGFPSSSPRWGRYFASGVRAIYGRACF